MDLEYIKISDYFESQICISKLIEEFGYSKFMIKESPYIGNKKYHYFDKDGFDLLVPQGDKRKVFNLINTQIEESNKKYKKVCDSVKCQELVPYKEVSYCGKHGIDLHDILGIEDKESKINLCINLPDMESIQFKRNSDFSLTEWIKNKKEPKEKKVETVEKFEEDPGSLDIGEDTKREYKLISEEIPIENMENNSQKSKINGIDVFNYPCKVGSLYYYPFMERAFANCKSSPEELRKSFEKFKKEIGQEDIGHSIVVEVEDIEMV